MAAQPEERVRKRLVWFSPYLLAVALMPAFLQIDYTGCFYYGDSTLSEFELIVEGENRITGFDSDQRSYDVVLPLGTEEARVRTVANDPEGRVWVFVLIAGERFTYLDDGHGGSDIVVPLPPGSSVLQVAVAPHGGATDIYSVGIQVGCVDCDDANECTTDACDPVLEMCTHAPVADDTACDFGGEIGTCVSGICERGFPCTEQGILDAIALGGGPHTFACNGPTTVTTQAEIVIDNDVILDGEGNLTIDGIDDHGVLVVAPDVTAELLGVTVSGGFAFQGGGILNEGTLSITDCIVEANRVHEQAPYAVGGGGIFNSGALTAMNSEVRDNRSFSFQGSGIHNTGTATLISSVVSGNGGHESPLYSTGTLTLIDTTVSENFASDDEGIHASGTVTLINSAVVNNAVYNGIAASGTLTLINSTVSGGSVAPFPAVALGGGTLTLINSTVRPHNLDRGSLFGTISSSGEMVVSNSLIVGSFDSAWETTCYGTGNVISGGGNIESPTNDCGLTDPTDLVNVSAEDLKLGPLADNGGPTPTHALLPGSVAIDRIPAAMCVDADGLPLTTDQRGVARPQGGLCDVGAFELADCSGSACDDGNDCTVDHCDPNDASWCAYTALPDGSMCDFGGFAGTCVSGTCDPSVFSCTEQGILDAIARGGGPYTFACDGSTTVVTQAEIVIDDDVILDGEGNLIIDGNDDHRVLSIESDAIVDLLGLTISSGRAAGSYPFIQEGAGIFNAGTLRLVDSDLVDNRDSLDGEGGGALHNEGTATLSDCRISGNRGSIQRTGAGIQNSGSLTAIRTTVSDNLSVDIGASIFNNGGTLTLIDSSLVRNSISTGTVILDFGGTTTLINCTLSMNDGYGTLALTLGAFNGGAATIINTTLMPSGGCFTVAGSISAANSVIGSGPLPGPCGGGEAACYEPVIVSGGGNIETLTDSCGFTDPSDQVAVSDAALNLGPLQDNGGPTETQALLPGSVAIDAVPVAACVDPVGDPLTEDQRGEPRPGGAMCDVGAFEVQP